MKSIFNDEQFKNPPKEERAITFWAWNNNLPNETLLHQIETFEKMGFGGFYMHSRIGMNVKYMSKEFMDKIKFCTQEAEKRGMFACLYDEDGFPSGYAGGVVSDNLEYAEKYLRLKHISGEDKVVGEEYVKAYYDIEFDEQGYMKSYKRIAKEDRASFSRWYAIVNTTPRSPRFNGNPYADLLNPDAVDCFIRETHEKYYENVGQYFGNTIKQIFTDEPRWMAIDNLKSLEMNRFATTAWTTKIPEIIQSKYGIDIFDVVPELFLDFQDRYSEIRYQYYLTISELFDDVFVKKCHDWCKAHNIEFTGHLDREETLSFQMSVCGEHMPKYLHFDVPGIDVLLDERRYTTAKQAQSIAHQTGKTRVLSELYGVTNYDFNFAEHKLSYDWQAALGITLRVPHLSWVSMKKNGKRDFPASIGMQAPWCEQYKVIEDHCARLNLVLSQGKPVVKVGVIHPIESMWMLYGAQQTSGGMIESFDTSFKKIAETLLLNQMDYDYISETTIPELANENQIGEMKYDVIVVPQCITLRKTTIDFLRNFMDQGGRVIFAGEKPEYTDGYKSNYVDMLYSEAEKVINEEGAILQTLEKHRIVEVCNEGGARDLRYLYQFRKEGDSAWLFIAKGTIEEHHAEAKLDNLTVKIKGNFKPVLYDTMTGEIRSVSYKTQYGNTYIYLAAYNHDSFLFRLDDGEGECLLEEISSHSFQRLLEVPKYTLEEPNVAVLDLAEWAVNDGEYQELNSIRTIESMVYETLNVPVEIRGRMQPWAKPEYKKHDTVKLCYRFHSDIEYDGAYLALEDAEDVKVMFNHEAVTSEICGYYVDMDIKKRKLPHIHRGVNTLELEFWLTKNSSFEPIYILGDFGVEVKGHNIIITEKQATLFWGDVVNQRLPFYAGNIAYECELDFSEDKELSLQIPLYEGSCLQIFIDDKSKELVFLAPYLADLGKITKGKHRITIRLFGNRENTFGNPHRIADGEYKKYNWDVRGRQLAFTYRLAQFGILTEPLLMTKKH